VHLIADDDVLDGVSYPSADITLTTGWLRIIDFDEEMLAAILAHEMAHIVQHHAAEFYGMSYLMRVLAQLGQLASKIVPNWHSFDKDANDGDGEWRRPLLFMQKHSRMLEHEADIVGQEIMAHAGYDPGKAIELWQLMIDLESESNRQTGVGSPSFTPTHSEHGHGVRHNTENDTLAMHPERPKRVKYLTENLMRVQRFYDKAYENGPTHGSFKNDLGLWRFEATVWALFGRIDMNGFSTYV
jgi:predicted Zn-dependent protease